MMVSRCLIIPLKSYEASIGFQGLGPRLRLACKTLSKPDIRHGHFNVQTDPRFRRLPLALLRSRGQIRLGIRNRRGGARDEDYLVSRLGTSMCPSCIIVMGKALTSQGPNRTVATWSGVNIENEAGQAKVDL
jgi:hypothetical protein